MRHLFAIIVFSVAAALLAGCGPTREARIEAKLESAGVKPRLAACLAPRLAAKLSDDELRALAHAVKPEPGAHRLGAGALAARIADSADPHTVDIVSRAALGCTLGV